MADRKRNIEEHKLYHITHRGDAHRPIFFTDEHRSQYLTYLRGAAVRYECRIHGWVLMDNHIHLVGSTNHSEGISRMMRLVQGSYGRFFNRSHHSEGKVWGGRFFSGPPLDEAHFLSCLAYMDLNPVRARLCHKPDEWNWSSHRFLAYGEPDNLTEEHPVYLDLSSVSARRRSLYRKFVEETRQKGLDF